MFGQLDRQVAERLIAICSRTDVDPIVADVSVECDLARSGGQRQRVVFSFDVEHIAADLRDRDVANSERHNLAVDWPLEGDVLIAAAAVDRDRFGQQYRLSERHVAVRRRDVGSEFGRPAADLLERATDTDGERGERAGHQQARVVDGDVPGCRHCTLECDEVNRRRVLDSDVSFDGHRIQKVDKARAVHHQGIQRIGSADRSGEEDVPTWILSRDDQLRSRSRNDISIDGT